MIREQSAKLMFVGLIPTPTSKICRMIRVYIHTPAPNSIILYNRRVGLAHIFEAAVETLAVLSTRGTIFGNDLYREEVLSLNSAGMD